MKKNLTVFVLPSNSGTIKRFSAHRVFVYCVIIVCIFLLCSGIIGIFKYRQNLSLGNEALLMQAEKDRLEAVARTVSEIRKQETVIREFLGLGHLPGASQGRSIYKNRDVQIEPPVSSHKSK